MTTSKAGAGVCLPPELPGTNVTWPSEGILVHRLQKDFGAAKAVEVFKAHRHSFIGDSDIDKMAALGLKVVRVPLTWAAFADALAPIDHATYGSHNPDDDSVVVPDPYYYETASYVTIPRSLIRQLLLKAARRGLKILLDIHAMPGGSSDGTYNGVWPQPPRFWRGKAQLGKSNLPLTQAGLYIARGLIQWVQGLDPEAKSAVGGLTLMNEPAHMAAVSAKIPGKDFADEESVLDWVAKAADIFRTSALPGSGVKLYVNFIETTFKSFSIPYDWWSKNFSASERHTWAVLDVHWYTAWSPECKGEVVPGGAYTCDQPIGEIRKLLRGCAEKYARKFAANVQGLKACSEFSCGTYEDAILACNDESVLEMFLDVQLEVFGSHNIEPFFWTWRMPYGETFQRGWSLKMLTHMEDWPAPHPCSPSFTEIM